MEHAMGWISLRTSTSAKEFLDAEFTFDHEDRRSSVLDSVFGDDGVYYAAVELVGTGIDERVVFGLVCLVEDDGGLAFSYKPISEAMGPRAFGCPAQILDRLTPTCQPYALAWRQNCRQRGAGSPSVATH
jgi:hypothetical protein